MNDEPQTSTRFTLTHWLQALFVIAMVVYSNVEVVYRFSLPTDGWMVTESELPGLLYTQNFLGEVGVLQVGDRVTAVEGRSTVWDSYGSSADFDEAWSSLRETWQPGAVMAYTVVRDGQEMTVPVTLARWQFAPFLANRLLDPVILYGLVSVTVLIVIAAAIFFRRPDNPAAFPFLIIITFFFVTSVSELLPFGISTWTDPLVNFFQDRINIFLLAVIFPYALIRFALVFPRPKPIHKRYPWLASAWLGFSTLLLLLTLGSIISWFWLLFSLFVSLAILVHNAFTMRDPVSRAQVRWGVGGVLIGIGVIAVAITANTIGLVQLSDQTFDLIGAFSVTVMGVMISVAITRYRLFDIDLIIRRTLQYALLTGLLALIYFGGIVILQNVFGGLFGDTESPLITVISTLAIAALFNPLRGRIQNFIDQRFFRSKYDAEKALIDFAAVARDEVDMVRLSGSLLSVVENTMQPDQTSLWLRETPRGE